MSSDTTVIRIEAARLEARRPRHAGSNARLGPHGDTVRPSTVRITLADGSTGSSFGHISRERAETLLGKPFAELFGEEYGGVSPEALSIECALWDLAGRRAGLPVYALAAQIAGVSSDDSEPLRVRCYDTSLYFDDLDLADDKAAAELLASEAIAGYDRGHRAFKIKVGRGAFHMPLDAGTRRDILIIKAIREAVGPDASLMIDANNGYNLNLTKHVLEETADCRLFWIEEAFHEDAVLYRDLKKWLQANGITTLIADGEGEASPSLLNWIRDGIVDVLQYDVFHPGLTRWLALGRQIAEWGGKSAPHHYGAYFGNYVTPHLARALPNLLFVEWDQADMPIISTPGYQIEEGMITVPNTPGFGMEWDEALFQKAVAESGFAVSV